MGQCECRHSTHTSQDQSQKRFSRICLSTITRVTLKVLSRVRIAFAKPRQVALLSAKTTEQDRLDNPG